MNQGVGQGGLAGRVMEEFGKRERAMGWKIRLLWMAGLPATLVGPLTFTGSLWILAFSFGRILPFLWMLLGAMVLVIPLVFGLERKTRGNYFGDSMEGVDRGNWGWWPVAFGSRMGLLRAFSGDPETTMVGFVEFWLWGPRQILEAVEKGRVVRRMEGVDRKRAGELVVVLLGMGGGVEVEKLRGAAEDGGKFSGAMGYLLVYDWIGVSKDGGKVWINSGVRKTLGG